MDSQLNPPLGETLQNQPQINASSSESHQKDPDQKDELVTQDFPSPQQPQLDMNPPSEGKISDPNHTQTPKQGISKVQDSERTVNKEKEPEAPVIGKEKFPRREFLILNRERKRVRSPARDKRE